MNRRKIFISNEVDSLVFKNEEINKLIHVLDSSQYRIADGDLSIVFLKKQSMYNLHLKFLNDSSVTDVITFSGDKNMDFAGEICICPEIALDNCKIHGTKFEDEVSLYLVHGYLHLYGLNDFSQNEIVNMRNGENFCMDRIKDLNSIPKFRSNAY